MGSSTTTSSFVTSSGAQGMSSDTRCDTEVLPHLYEQDDKAFEARLRGKFGLAVWDARRRRAVLARDPLGVKPLYFAVVGDVLVFASELKSVLASGLVSRRTGLRGNRCIPLARLRPWATHAPRGSVEAGSRATVSLLKTEKLDCPGIGNIPTPAPAVRA